MNSNYWLLLIGIIVVSKAYELCVIKNKKKRKLLVLDLNGLLIDRTFVKEYKKQDNTATPTKIGAFFVWKRPHLDTFIDYILQNFNVSVWSSAKINNVQNLVDFIFEDRQKELIFMWDQSKCIAEHRDDTHPLFLKPIDKILEVFPEYKDRILFIDDSPEKLKKNGNYTYVSFTMWDMTKQDDDMLSPNGALITYLKKLNDSSSSIQYHVENNPF